MQDRKQLLSDIRGYLEMNEDAARGGNQPPVVFF